MLEDPIARRYLVMNAFDGVMTALGVVLGSVLAGAEPLLVFKAGFGAALAIMVSGFWGAFMTERAERIAEIKEMEKLLMRKLDGSVIKENARKMTLELALIDALSPFFGSLIPLSPFLLSHIGLFDLKTAFYLSLLLSFALLLALGFFLAKIMKEDLIKNGLVFAFGGLLVGFFLFFLEKLF
mgnify:CR=1 FL=1